VTKTLDTSQESGLRVAALIRDCPAAGVNDPVAMALALVGGIELVSPESIVRSSPGILRELQRGKKLNLFPPSTSPAVLAGQVTLSCGVEDESNRRKLVHRVARHPTCDKWLRSVRMIS
jgi:hypothetical protein